MAEPLSGGYAESFGKLDEAQRRCWVAAHHEAGHAVVGYLLGHPCVNLQLYATGYGMYWHKRRAPRFFSVREEITLIGEVMTICAAGIGGTCLFTTREEECRRGAGGDWKQLRDGAREIIWWAQGDGMPCETEEGLVNRAVDRAFGMIAAHAYPIAMLAHLLQGEDPAGWVTDRLIPGDQIETWIARILEVNFGDRP